MKTLRKGHLPYGSRWQIDKVAATRFNQVHHVLTLENIEGQPVEWHFCDPCRLLQYMVSVCPKLEKLYADAAMLHPDPWKVIVMFDEFAPGHQLKTNNHRKSMTLCFSFLELGRRALVQRCVWMVPVVVRTRLYLSCKGGWSYFLKVFLEHMFLGPSGLQTAGVPLTLNGNLFLLKASLVHLVSDGDGLRSALNWRGASSLRPCWCHWNVTKKGSGLAEHNSALVETSCTDPDKFLVQTHNMLLENVALVKAANERFQQGLITKSMLDSIGQSTGITYNELGMLWSERTLNMLTPWVVTVDWVHTMLCDGVFGCEVYLLLNRAQEKLGIGFGDVRLFLSDWVLPVHSKATIHEVRRLFTDFRHSYSENHEKLKASASELLSTYGLLRHFALLHLKHDSIVQEALSFELCCHLMDGILDAKHGQMSMAEASNWLKRAHQGFLEMHIATYGIEYLKPKHHWVFDIAEQWMHHTLVPDAFLVEKQHLRAKEVADRVRNTICFERSVLTDMLNSQVAAICELGKDFELLSNATQYPGVPGSLVGDTLSIMGVEMSVNDIVFLNDAAGKVLACIQEGDEFSVIVELLSLHVVLTPHAFIGTWNPRRVVWDAKLVQVALAWRQSEQYPGCLEIVRR